MEFPNAYFIKLLKLDAQHTRKISALEKLCDGFGGLHVEILDAVLDAMGVPPDEFCRESLHERWLDILEAGTDRDIESFPDLVREEMRKLESANGGMKEQMRTRIAAGLGGRRNDYDASRNKVAERATGAS